MVSHINECVFAWNRAEGEIKYYCILVLRSKISQKNYSVCLFFVPTTWHANLLAMLLLRYLLLNSTVHRKAGAKGRRTPNNFLRGRRREGKRSDLTLGKKEEICAQLVYC